MLGVMCAELTCTLQSIPPHASPPVWACTSAGSPNLSLLPNGTICTLTCEAGYVLSAPSTTCINGVMPVLSCLRECGLTCQLVVVAAIGSSPTKALRPTLRQQPDLQGMKRTGMPNTLRTDADKGAFPLSRVLAVLE